MKWFKKIASILKVKINTLRPTNNQKRNHTMTKFQVSRIVHVLQATAVKAKSECEAIELSRKLPFKAWSTIDRKRRKGYKAVKVEYTE